ncbi:MAG: hypothetical protein HC933_02040 [Pleurocapsa sp. SU_196_0]|nr:hypothetical protein [Pleurocapsa sp. SU_196_0]
MTRPDAATASPIQRTASTGSRCGAKKRSVRTSFSEEVNQTLACTRPPSKRRKT